MSTKHEQLKQELSKYETYYEAALRLTLARLNNLDSSLKNSGNSSPFSSITHRIKTFDSILEKVGRRKIKPDIDAIKAQIHDIAGIRIITVFYDEIFMVADLIGKIPGVTIVEKKDYVTTPKPNGYSSLHLIVQVEIYDPHEGSKLIPVEIQIRDKTMDVWASIEHRVRYKHPNPSPEVEERFKKAAKALRDFAAMAMELRDHE